MFAFHISIPLRKYQKVLFLFLDVKSCCLGYYPYFLAVSIISPTVFPTSFGLVNVVSKVNCNL